MFYGLKYSFKMQEKRQVKFMKHCFYDVFWNKETGYFLKGIREKFVIGKIVNGRLLELTDDDENYLKSNEFAYEMGYTFDLFYHDGRVYVL